MTGGTTYAVAEAAGAAVQILFDGKKEVTRFASLAAVETLYTRTVPKSRQGELLGLLAPCMLRGTALPLRRNSLQPAACGSVPLARQLFTCCCCLQAPLVHCHGTNGLRLSSSCRADIKDQIDTTLKPFSFDANKLQEAFYNFPEELRQVRCLGCAYIATG